MRVLPSVTGAALAAAATVLLSPTAALAGAPGDNGDVKIHESTTAVDDQRNEPKVCTFYLDAFHFDGLQSVSWTIDPQPAHGSQDHAATGTITLDAQGDGHTATMTLDPGQYKLYWTFAGEHGEAKHKVFKVDCSATGTPTPSPSTTTPGSTSSGGDTGTGGTTTGGTTTGGDTTGGGTSGGDTSGGTTSTGGSTGTPGSSSGGSSTTPAAAPSASSGSGTGSLAETGASVGGIAALAAVLVGVGAFVRFRRKGAARQH